MGADRGRPHLVGVEVGPSLKILDFDGLRLRRHMVMFRSRHAFGNWIVRQAAHFACLPSA
jgi:hypothetical protein